jgi:hypothetical protein
MRKFEALTTKKDYNVIAFLLHGQPLSTYYNDLLLLLQHVQIKLCILCNYGCWEINEAAKKLAILYPVSGFPSFNLI